MKNMNPKLPNIYDKCNSPIKVGLCQIYTEAWDLEGNFQRTLAALEEAAAQGAQVAITPECVLHGYGIDENIRTAKHRYADIAEPIDGPRLAAVRELARRKSIYIVLGFAEQSTEGLFYNSAAVISGSGDIVDIYHKVHCRTFENVNHAGAFTPGERFTVTDMTIESQNFKMGTMICFDREIPESARCLRALGAHLIACPLACNTEALDKQVNYAHNEMITRCRAAENELFIVVVNHSGRFNGGSFVVGPGGEALVQLGSEAEVRVIDIPVNAVADKIHSNAYGWMGWSYRRQKVYDCYLSFRTPNSLTTKI